ncbi:alpha/beta hydrolase [Actinobacteria bacterium YIM 96077]|uniref:Alpha/beta hydrolase n=1 Tax=Phytoactinopolyspora halophila TaxID=1981511 RepID=A0A329QWU9_9ACTN|nr:alpha/beta hydrolase [Phytoactinopolyspora halophila]AYY12760.1 alpha/beta hydrolase [Actinobacteria bacterium YIM 96077]RAW16446.1 alpha/beta hydrolase [Phytoactinopolyspora halophila]
MAGRAIERTEGYLRTSDGDTLWYETAGTGTPLVLAHGLGGNAVVWFQQLPHFAGRYRVITWDQRGFGRSSNDNGRAGPQTSVHDQLALLDHLDVDTAHLVGQSLGGWAVLGAALAAPERVRSLVLSSSTAGIPALHLPPFDAGPVQATYGTKPLSRHPAIGDRLPESDPPRAYLYQALSSFGRRPPDADFATMLAETVHDADALGELTIPTLLICGSRDPVMTPGHVRDAAQRLPDARVVELDLSHSTYFEDPQTWNGVVDDFLHSVDTPGDGAR